MTPEIQQLEDSIKKVHRFAYTPKYKESFQTKLSATGFKALALKAIEQLDWDVVFISESGVEAKRKNDWGTYSEAIAINYSYGEVQVQSKTLGNEMWDMGRNSKRVKLFILVFNNLQKELTPEELKTLESEQKKKDEMSDYVVPETLPAPLRVSKSNFASPVFITIISSLIIAYMLAFMTSKGYYILVLFDVVAGILLGLALGLGLKLGNYTNASKLNVTLITSVVIMFAAYQLLIFKFFLQDNPNFNIGFIEFIKLRLEAGLTVRNIDTGWIGLVCSWLLLLAAGYFFGLFTFTKVLLDYQIKRIPPEVLEFGVYQAIKNRSMEQLRSELAKRGWTNPTDQDYVVEAVSAIASVNEINRA